MVLINLLLEGQLNISDPMNAKKYAGFAPKCSFQDGATGVPIAPDFN